VILCMQRLRMRTLISLINSRNKGLLTLTDIACKFDVLFYIDFCKMIFVALSITCLSVVSAKFLPLFGYNHGFICMLLFDT